MVANKLCIYSKESVFSVKSVGITGFVCQGKKNHICDSDSSDSPLVISPLESASPLYIIELIEFLVSLGDKARLKIAKKDKYIQEMSRKALW